MSRTPEQRAAKEIMEQSCGIPPPLRSIAVLSAATVRSLKTKTPRKRKEKR